MQHVPQGADAQDTRPQNLEEEELYDQRGEEQSSAPRMQHVPPPIHKVVTLSYPWGTHDPHPPAGWSAAANEDPSRMRSLHLQRHASLPPSPLSASVSDGDQHVRSIKRRRDRHVALPVAERCAVLCDWQSYMSISTTLYRPDVLISIADGSGEWGWR